MIDTSSINAQTKVCAVIGNPIIHSLSPLVHNAAFQAVALNYIYVAFKVEDLKGAIMGMRSFENLIGLSVTIPHKVEIIHYLDDLDPIAKNMGSVNTVVSQQGRLKGYSTDGTGAIKALKIMDINLNDKNVIIIGSGGAARAITFALSLEKEVNSIIILGIDEPEVNALVNDLKNKTALSKIKGRILSDKSLQQEIPNTHILINCSPIGMHPHIDDMPIDSKYLHKDMAVMDIVYNPIKTKLLHEAEQIGCQIIPGLEMFINQAALQFELWTGHPAPIQVMKHIIMNYWQGNE